MKKHVILSCLVSIIAFNTIAQTHIKNQSFLELGICAYDKLIPSPSGFGFSILTGKYNKNLNAHIFKVSYNRKKIAIQDSFGTIPNYSSNVKSVFASYIYEKNMYRNFNNTLLLNVPLGANIGYESINDNNRLIKDRFNVITNSDYILGPTAGIQVQYLNFTAGTTANLNLVSNYSKFSIFPTLSYRYHL